MSAFLIETIWGVTLLALTASAAADLRARLIPNRFSILIALCGLTLQFRLAPAQVWISLLAATTVFGALGVLAHFNVLGGGDVKLISAAALLVAPDRIPFLLAEIALAGGLLSAFYLAAGLVLRRWPQLYRQPSRNLSGGLGKWLKREGLRAARGYPVPYALAVFCGVTFHIIGEFPSCLDAISCSF
jgi:prepilin peptidase CpaA